MSRNSQPASIRYPLIPKSTASLQPGQFWAIPLDQGGYGCGRVLSLKIDKTGRVDRRTFLAGLMDWIGSEPPHAEDLCGVSVIEPGIAHIKTILATGGAILGHRELQLDGNEPGYFLDACYGGNVYQGLIYQRPATKADEQVLPVLSTYGYLVLKIAAENLARKKTPKTS